MKPMTDAEAMLPENVEFRHNGNELATTALDHMIAEAREVSDGQDWSVLSLVMFAAACIVGAVAARMRELGCNEQDVGRFGDMLIKASEAGNNDAAKRNN